MKISTSHCLNFCADSVECAQLLILQWCGVTDPSVTHFHTQQSRWINNSTGMRKNVFKFEVNCPFEIRIIMFCNKSFKLYDIIMAYFYDRLSKEIK